MKVKRPGEKGTDATGPSPKPYDKAKEAAIERQRTPYIELECGHLSTWEIDELFSVFRIDELTIYCEKCREFQYRLPKKRIRPPDEPMF